MSDDLRLINWIAAWNWYSHLAPSLWSSSNHLLQGEKSISTSLWLSIVLKLIRYLYFCTSIIAVFFRILYSTVSRIWCESRAEWFFFIDILGVGEEKLSSDRENEGSSMFWSKKEREGRKAVSTLYFCPYVVLLSDVERTLISIWWIISIYPPRVWYWKRLIYILLNFIVTFICFKCSAELRTEIHSRDMAHAHNIEDKLKPEMSVKPSALWQKRQVSALCTLFYSGFFRVCLTEDKT